MKPILASRMTLTFTWLFFFVLTHWPKEAMPEGPAFMHLDKVIHFLLYTILGFLLSHREFDALNYRKQVLIVFSILAAYGFFDEFTQPYIGRTAEFLDWIADICGVAAGITLHWKLVIKKAQV
jgi:VanZ family protein